MSIVQNPLIGVASGSAGNSVFQYYNGKKIMRRKPFTYTDANSSKQKSARAAFAAAIIKMLTSFAFLPEYLYPFAIRKRSKYTQFQIEFSKMAELNNTTAGKDNILGYIGNSKNQCAFIPYVYLVSQANRIQRFIFSFSQIMPTYPGFYPRYFLTIIFNTTLNNFKVEIVEYSLQHQQVDIAPAEGWSSFDSYIFAQMDLGNQTDISTQNSNLICQGYNTTL